jgi:predicted dehydrogenase
VSKRVTSKPVGVEGEVAHEGGMEQRARVLLVGLGGNAKDHVCELLDCAWELGAELSGAVETQAERRERRNDLPLARGYFEKHSADLAIICSPIHVHRPQVIEAMEAGAHVLCEKPASGSIQEALLMERAAEQEGKHFAIGYQWSFSESVRQLRSEISRGNYGRPHDN